jgi:hypothetical protein
LKAAAQALGVSQPGNLRPDLGLRSGGTRTSACLPVRPDRHLVLTVAKVASEQSCCFNTVFRPKNGSLVRPKTCATTNSTATGSSLCTFLALRRSKRSPLVFRLPAAAVCCSVHRPGGPFLHWRITFSPPLLHSRLTSAFRLRATSSPPGTIESLIYHYSDTQANLAHPLQSGLRQG